MTHLDRQRARRLAPALALLATLALASPSNAQAAAGELRPDYGSGGVAGALVPVSARPAYALILGRDPGPALVVAPDGAVLVARVEGGRCSLERFGRDGNSGLERLGDAVTCSDRLRPEVGLGPRGEILFVYAPDADTLAIQRRRPDGTPEVGFGDNGTVRLRPGSEAVGRCFATLLPNGELMVAVNGAPTSVQHSYSKLLLVRLAVDGRTATWGSNGVVTLAGFEWGPLDTEGFGVVVDGPSTSIFGSSRNGFFQQSFGARGAFYGYFPPETSVGSDSPIISEFNDGALAALFTFGGELSYDGPAARFQALPASAFRKLRLPAAIAGSGSRVTPLRFRPLPGGGLLVAALHEELAAGVAYGRLVLLRFLPGGDPDPGFGRDGVAGLDLPLGGPPYALPQMLSAPTVLSDDRVMLAAWGAGRIAAASVQQQDVARVAGTLGWLARDGRFVTATDATDATLRFRVARQGGRRGAASVAYRSVAPATLAGRYVPVSGRLEWADGEDASREVALTLRAGPVADATGTIGLVLENASGASLGTAVQQVAIADYSGGTIAFQEARATVRVDARTVRVGVTRSGSARGALQAAVRVPLPGDTGRVAVAWADGESGMKNVDLPFDQAWAGFGATLELPANAQPGARAVLEVQITEVPRATAAAPSVAAAAPVAGAGGGSGGGALDPAALGLLFAALVLRARRSRCVLRESTR